MAKQQPQDMRNIALCGQSGSGKTMLAEAMLFRAKAVNRLGSISGGSTASDFDPLEKEQQYSINPSFLLCPHAGKEIRIIDAPGGIDLIGGQISAMAGADLVLICVNAARGIEVVTRKVWDLAESMGKPRAVVITRMDADNVNYEEVLASVRKTFGTKCVPVVAAQGESSSFAGATNVLAKDAAGDEVESLKSEVTECVVESDDAMMEKYLEQGEISDEELFGLLTPALLKGAFVPVFALAAEKDLGVAELMDAVAQYGPHPLQLPVRILRGEEEAPAEETVEPSADGKLLAQVIKTVSDPHVGKLSFVRVFSGSFDVKANVTLARTGKTEKMAQLYRHHGEKHEDIPTAGAGEIVTIGKVEELRTGDTLCAEAGMRLPQPPFPQPMVGLAVVPKARGDEQKIGLSLQRLADEDPTFTAGRDPQTNELVIRGMGLVQLDLMLARMKARYGVEVHTKPPRIPYLETISAKAEGHYRHKKQTGGAGQFAEVYIRVMPNERGAGFEFVNAIVGGAISQPFVGSTEKGCRQAIEKGPLAGYPVVDVRVEIYDGKEHPVDSKDIAFQIAGRYAFYDALEKAKPVMLEPIVNLEVFFPAAYTGDINGDISGRRGRPTGMDSLGDLQVVKAQVPLAEVADYGSALKAITQGEGFFSLTLSHYEPVPANVAQQVIARLKAEAEAEEKEKR